MRKRRPLLGEGIMQASNAKIRRPARSEDARWERLVEQWAVATCDRCGAILVLGEGSRPHGHASLCLSCRTLHASKPAQRVASRPPRQVERIRVGVGDVGVSKLDRFPEGELSDAA
jgi:hypothetical protein